MLAKIPNKASHVRHRHVFTNLLNLSSQFRIIPGHLTVFSCGIPGLPSSSQTPQQLTHLVKIVPPRLIKQHTPRTPIHWNFSTSNKSLS